MTDTELSAAIKTLIEDREPESFVILRMIKDRLAAAFERGMSHG